MNETINQVGAGAPAAWTKAKPTAPGAYWIRGEGEGMLARTALVEVVNFEGELWCNLHMRNTDPEFGYGYTVAQLDEAFEWLGPLVPAAPVVRAEQEPVGHELDGLAGDLLVAADLVRNKAVSSRLVEYSRHAAKLAYCTPAPDAALVEALESMTCAYRMAIQAGHARITALGGDCDSVEQMLADFPEYGKAIAMCKAHRVALAGKGGE